MAHLFYPSHDIALGNGVKHFNPPFAARRLEEDLCALADIWNTKYNMQDEKEGKILIPWGWDYDTRALLNKEYGIKLKNLPTDFELHQLRELSSRKTTIEILRRLKEKSNEYNNITIPKYLDSEEKLKNFIESEENFVLKTPWSSSGRGLSRSSVCTKETLLKHGAATIRKMGGILAEKWYKKIQDFAMLFYVGKNEVKFVGYSIFDNDEAGTYRCGKLLSNKNIEALLPKSIDETKENILEILNDIFSPFFNKSWEIGFIGIDMMTCKCNDLGENTNGIITIHPCVEMNLRCTMGVVARMYFDQNCEEDETGEFFITPALEHGKLLLHDRDLNEKHGERYRRLTNILPDSMFMAYTILNR